MLRRSILLLLELMGIEPMALNILGKHFNTELYPHPSSIVFKSSLYTKPPEGNDWLTMHLLD